MTHTHPRPWAPFLVLVLVFLLAGPAMAGVPQLTLAQVYEQGVPLEDYWVSEKLDGVRAYWDGDKLVSRQGHRFHAPDWFTRDFPDTPMDGELWLGRGTFSELSGVVRKLEPVDAEWRQVHYEIFDLPAHPGPFSERVAAMQRLLQPSPSPYLSMIEQTRGTTHAALMGRLDDVVAAGAEGLMLHRGDSRYHAGRNDDLLKVKKYQDAEADVVGYSPGKGKYEGMLGALVVERSDGRRFKLGTGFSDEQRAHPPAMGATVTYKFYGYTSTGLPRFASFMRVRDDEPAEE
ncbi:DNA ligase [Marinobacter bohaiensis]|uniref:DNA ligase n=1 Tax=Marinobacter bohaiensis TaxID=2201898 RepID=UPI000DAE7B90|nr:DNA ligase [Marinobacter bohaiensis]